MAKQSKRNWQHCQAKKKENTVLKMSQQMISKNLKECQVRKVYRKKIFKEAGFVNINGVKRFRILKILVKDIKTCLLWSLCK